MIRATIAAFAALIFATAAFANDLAGQASIIDGDTLEIHGTRVRLWGIDAPESRPRLPIDSGKVKFRRWCSSFDHLS
jgi:endonuclease YncB( thermonuclease family)